MTTNAGSEGAWTQDELHQRAEAAKLHKKTRNALTEEKRDALDRRIFEICNENGENAMIHMRKALKSGGDSSYRDEDGQTPLHFCALEGNVDTVRMLIEAGADVEAPSTSGTTPYTYAEANGHTAVMNLLVRHGAKRVVS